MENIASELNEHKLRVQLIAIAGTSNDILLSIFVLKSYILSDQMVSQSLVFETNHYKYILPSKMEESCQKIMDDVTQFGADIVGFSTYTWNYDVVMRVASLIKKMNPKVKILLGGPEIAGSDIIKGKYDKLPIDYLIFGEGENPFLKLIRCLIQENENDLNHIPRLAYRNNQGFNYKDLDNPEADILPNLFQYPSPYLLKIIPENLLNQKLQANIESQRGCNFRCAYCLYHANFPSIRYRNAEDVIEEIDYLYQHGVKNFRITDANFLSNKNFAATILREMIRRKIKMSFFFEVIPSFIDEQIAKLMKEYHDYDPDNQILVGIGLQTINIESLKAIRRKLPIEHFTRAYRLLSDAGIIIKTDIILGLPYETKETYFDLMEYIADKMEHGYNYLSLALLRILPGSELDMIAKAAGLVVDNEDSEHFVYETPTISRKDLVECFKISGVAFRFFHTINLENRLKLRAQYFDVKNKLKVSHIRLFQHFSKFFENYLSGTNSDYVKEDFPRAEHYWYFDMHKEISDEIITSELDRLSTSGFDKG